MREILFRGKRIDTWTWVEGYYAQVEGKHFVIEVISEHVVNWHKVLPETIGQYTGLNDKNGQRIFEGDLVEAVLPPSLSQPRFVWPIMPVVFYGCTFGLQDYRGNAISLNSFAPSVTLEVKGNIHDNPELLKEPTT